MERTLFLAAADRYKDMVYRIALNYFGNSFDAEDTVQDVLMKLYTGNRRFESEEHLKYWLIRVTINTCKNPLRTPWRRKRADPEELAETLIFERPEESDLFLAVMELEKKYRTVLYLFYYEDLPVREIANILEVKESAVTTRLSRARERLKIKLKEAWQDE